MVRASYNNWQHLLIALSTASQLQNLALSNRAASNCGDWFAKLNLSSECPSSHSMQNVLQASSSYHLEELAG